MKCSPSRWGALHLIPDHVKPGAVELSSQSMLPNWPHQGKFPLSGNSVTLPNRLICSLWSVKSLMIPDSGTCPAVLTKQHQSHSVRSVVMVAMQCCHRSCRGTKQEELTLRTILILKVSYNRPVLALHHKGKRVLQPFPESKGNSSMFDL